VSLYAHHNEARPVHRFFERLPPLIVMLGGSWNNHNPRLLRCSYRYKLVPVIRWLNIGFRCVREALQN